MANNQKNLKEQIYENVYSDIIRGEYSVEDIITEKELIKKYNVSKSPVREALIELCNDKVLKSIPRMGYQIARVMPKQLRDAVELREMIELKVFESIKKSLDQAMINELKEYNAETQKIKSEHDVLKHWNRNIGFHLLLCSYYNNSWMYDTLKSILNFFTRAAPQYYSKIWDKDNEVKELYNNSHQLFIKNLEERNFDKCEEILKKDTEAIKNILFM